MSTTPEGSMIRNIFTSRSTTARFCVIRILLVLAASSQAAANNIHVPLDYPTIKLAVADAQDGDSIEVADGIYLETGIVVDKRISIGAAHPYGAVIYGRRETGDAIFCIRSEALIYGFVLKDSAAGIEQRLSPDVLWRAHGLLIMDINVGISVNDASENIGRADLRSIMFYNCGTGVSTNDAGGIDVTDCRIVDCAYAFAGCNHLYFKVAETTLVNSGMLNSGSWRFTPKPPATNGIILGPGVETVVLEPESDERLFPPFVSSLEDWMGLSSASDERGSTFLRKRALAGLLKGHLLLKMGKASSASGYFQEACADSATAGSPEFMAQARYGMAKAYETQGRIELCLQAYRELIDLVDEIRATVPTGLYSTNYVSDKMQGYEKLIGLLYDRHAKNPGKGWASEALAYAEKSRGAGRFPFGGRIDDGIDMFPALREKRERIEQEISSLQTALADSGVAAQQIASLRASLERAEDRYHGYLIEWERAAAGGRPRPSNTGLSLNRDNSLPDKAAVIEYFLGRDRSFAFLLSGREPGMVELPPKRTINELTDNFLRLVEFGELGDAPLLRAGARLSSVLLGPFASSLNVVDRIIVVPDGHLCFLPFGALGQYDAETDQPRFVIERWEIEYAPSVRRYLAGVRQCSGSSSGSKALVIGSDGVAVDNRSSRYPKSFRGLRFVFQEIDAVAEACRGMGMETLVNARANEGWLKSLDLERYGVFHFSGHGIIDDEKWWRSALMLDGGRGGREDGFLSPLEISQLRLHADLVVLSGCQTGIGRLYEGEGIKGLAWSFLETGARSVLVSLWSVDDRATAELMARFYENIRTGMSLPQALKLAKTAMLRKPGASAFTWAPFILIGDDGRFGRKKLLSDGE